ncbi:MAG: serine hydrolase domain-containing protein, partial [Ilumatobacteraceae bacterium]
CSDGSEEATSTSTSPSINSTDGSAPTVITKGDPRAEEIVGLVREAVPELHLQSVVFGVWEGDTEIVRAAVDGPGSMPPTSPDAVVRVGQPIEAMLGTVLLQLVEEGVLGLDDPVGEYLPELVNGYAITPRMLANTTSGTPEFLDNADFLKVVYADPFAEWTGAELLAAAQESPPLFEPGQGWAYSHTDITLLGEVLEAATGQTVAELLASRVFEPLGMTHSAVFTTNEIGTPTFHAYSNERGVYEETTFWNPTWALNSGNLNATVEDLGRWSRALNRGELLDDESFDLMMAANTAGLGPMTEAQYFSFGMLVVDDWIVGNPSLQGYQGFTGQLRDPEVTIVVYSTGSVTNTGEGNASITIGTRISELMAPDEPLVMPS